MSIRILITILALAMAAFSQSPPIEPGVSHQLAKWRAARYSDVRYKLNLTLEKMSPVLKGTMEIRLRVQPMRCKDCVDEPIILDWRKIPGHEKDSTISNVSINGQPMEVRGGGAFQIQDTKPYVIEDREHLIFGGGKEGENVIKLDFTSPILTSGSAITRYVDKEDGAEYIYSLFVPSDASTAFPVFDQPDLKARFSLQVKHPDDWMVISNSAGEDFIENVAGINDKMVLAHSTVFPTTNPISTYVFAFAAGSFQQWNECALNGKVSDVLKCRSDAVTPYKQGINVFVRKSQSIKFNAHYAEVFRLNREGIKFLESYFDYKFPFPKYDIVLIPEFPFGGMEHAGATFLREASVIFPQEPTKNDYISRANVIFHEAAHQWFGDTVTMKWFDDLWLKEGFAEFMAYKTLEKVMPEYNAWKVFYERNKQAAYLTDSTKGTTPIYQEIANLNSAKSAYGNIVYRKAPSFLKQAEFYLGPDKFRTAVRAFLKKHEYANAGWEDLVKEFQNVAADDLKQNKSFPEEKKPAAEQRIREDIKNWATIWVNQAGLPIVKAREADLYVEVITGESYKYRTCCMFTQILDGKKAWPMRVKTFSRSTGQKDQVLDGGFSTDENSGEFLANAHDSLPRVIQKTAPLPLLVFPNYQDYGYGIFLLDDKSRDYVLKNIGSEKDDFLRSMMWGSLWDSVREGELDPKEYVELVVRNIKLETDESTVQTLLGRVSTATRYYLSEPHAVAGGLTRPTTKAKGSNVRPQPPATAGGSDLTTRVETLLIDRMQNASTPGQKITYYRAFLNMASSENARRIMKVILRGNAGILPARGAGKMPAFQSNKDKFDIVSKLIILGDPEAPKLLADLEKTETSDEAKRYAYAAKAGFATAENKAKFWTDFVSNKDISESWIEAAFGPFNSVRHSGLTLPYLEKALAELPNLKRSCKIFFVNGWLGAFIGGQKSEAALAIVNKFLADNPNLDKDLRLKILENVDLIERAVRIRGRFGKS